MTSSKQSGGREGGPRYDHDCESCVWLGRRADDDVYFCSQGDQMPTIVFRYGSAPELYRSGTHLIETLEPDLKAKAVQALTNDPDVRLILSILNEAGGELHIEHLEHRYYERGGS